MEEASCGSSPVNEIPSNGGEGTQNTAPNSTPSADVSVEIPSNASAPNLPSNDHPKKKGKKRSRVWDHFVKFDSENGIRARCHYCTKDVCGDSKSGTTVMKNHILRCKEYPPNKDHNQALLSLQKSHIDGVSGLTGEKIVKLEFRKFSQSDSRLALSKMIIMDEKPFRTVEHEGFRLFVSVLQPQFSIPSRWTVARDCFIIYSDEKAKLKNYLSKISSRICLTTDTWTSVQNLNYMCLTAHFIDDDWKLHKKILNFCPISGHSGEEIGKSVEGCLIEWGITTKILTVTVDNASANDSGIRYLRNRLLRWNSALLEGKFLHMRCAAHILSLVVKEGLKESNESIHRIRHAVRFVRSSPARSKRFKICVSKEQIESKRLLCLDIETRWNSTYHMLDTALIFRNAFHELENSDGGKFSKEMEKYGGAPSDKDWDEVTSFLPFLKIFYESTLKFSGTLYTTSNTYLQELVGIGVAIKKKRDSDEGGVSLMAYGMKKKYDKYWDDVKNINLLLYIAVIIDPRRKMDYVRWAIRQQYDVEQGEELLDLVKKTLESLYAHYASFQPSVHSPPQEVDLNAGESEAHDMVDISELEFEKDVGSQNVTDKKNELEKYLEEKRETNRIDILEWWKKRQETYPTLCLLVKDVLAIPVSTVASESAFSTGGRVLDQFRSSLSARMAEALVCAQDWLRTTHGPIIVEEAIDEMEEMEKDLPNQQSSSIVDDYF